MSGPEPVLGLVADLFLVDVYVDVELIVRVDQYDGVGKVKLILDVVFNLIGVEKAGFHLSFMDCLKLNEPETVDDIEVIFEWNAVRSPSLFAPYHGDLNVFEHAF